MRIATKITPSTTIAVAQAGIAQQKGSSAYYSTSEFRQLTQEDLQRLLKKHGRI